MLRVTPLCLALAFFLAPVLVAGEIILVRAARIYPVAGPPIDDGAIVVRDGKITEVGREVSIDPGTPGVRIIGVDGSVCPGFIDAGSSIGILGRASEEFRELTPEVRVLGAVELEHRSLTRALEEGVTLVASSPGGRNVIGGIGALLRTGPAPLDAAQAVISGDAFLEVSLTEEAESGNFNLRGGRPYTYIFRTPNTRMGTIFLVRRAFFEAMDRAGPPEGLDSLAQEAGLAKMLLPEGQRVLREAIDGKRILRVRADERQELLSALRLAEEFHARIQIVGGAEAAPLAHRLAERGIGVILDPGSNPRDENPALSPEYTARLPAILAREGVVFAYFSRQGDAVPLLRERVAMSLRFGVPEDKALEALTLGAARLLGIVGRTGSIEVGKEADLVGFSGGGPLDITARVEWVLSGGRLTELSSRASAFRRF